jgi:hypothetical protein
MRSARHSSSGRQSRRQGGALASVAWSMRRFSQDAQPALHHQAQFPAGAAGHAARPAGRPRASTRPPSRTGRAHQPRVPGCLGSAAGRRPTRRVRCIGHGQVVAATWAVHAQVLPEVDQLQRGADGVGTLQRRRVVSCRTGAAAGGRPGWPSGGSSPAAPRGRGRAGCAHPARRRPAGRAAGCGQGKGRTLPQRQRREDGCQRGEGLAGQRGSQSCR